jgi:hypothetical protein
MSTRKPTDAEVIRAYETIARLTDDKGRLKHIHTMREFDDAHEIILASQVQS